MLKKLLTESAPDSTGYLDRMGIPELLAAMNAADAAVAGAVAREIPRIAQAVEAIESTLRAGGRLFYLGAGTSGRLGVLDAAECPPTFGVSKDLVTAIIAGGAQALVESSEAAEDNRDEGARELAAAGCRAGDAVVGISASGRTPYVLGAMVKARALGVVTCGISCNPGSELSAAVAFPIEVATGPEILAGSTRLRAGTATKMILNMISTAVMVRLGHVYGNLMVNVQPTNEKLADRARRIIAQATGASATRAAELLEAAGSARVAIVMQKKNVNRAEAERLLSLAGGRIREALGEDKVTLGEDKTNG